MTADQARPYLSKCDSPRIYLPVIEGCEHMPPSYTEHIGEVLYVHEVEKAEHVLHQVDAFLVVEH